MFKYSKLVVAGITGVAGGIYIDRNILPQFQDTAKNVKSTSVVGKYLKRVFDSSIKVHNFLSIL